MEEYRKSVYQQLEVHNLLDMTMVNHQTMITMFHRCSDKKSPRCWRKIIKLNNFFFLLSCHQITKAADSSPAPDPPSLQPSPGQHSVPTKPLVSTDTFRKEKKTNTPQNEQSDAETAVPKLSSQPDTPSTPAAAPKIDVSATLSNVHHATFTQQYVQWLQTLKNSNNLSNTHLLKTMDGQWQCQCLLIVLL